MVVMGINFDLLLNSASTMIPLATLLQETPCFLSTYTSANFYMIAHPKNKRRKHATSVRPPASRGCFVVRYTCLAHIKPISFLRSAFAFVDEVLTHILEL